MAKCRKTSFRRPRRLLPLGVSAALVGVPTLLHSQGAPTTDPAPPATSTTSAPSTQPAVGDLGLSPATQPAQPTIRLDFKDAPLDTVLEQLSQAAGFVVVREAPLQARVTVMSIRPVTPQEAVAILDTELKGNGLTAIRDGRTLRIMQRDKAKKGDIPVHFGDDPERVESNDSLITQVIPIKNIDAVKLANDLKPLIALDADFTSNAGSNAVVLTDTSANVKRIVRIIAALDRREGTASEIRIIHLKNASAESAARLVLSIFRPPDAHRGPQPGQPPAPPAPKEATVGSGVDQALYGGKVTASADERTNTVVVAGPGETVKLIEQMLHDLDTNPSTEVTIKSFHLKIADAPGVARMLPFIFENGAQPGQARGVGSQSMNARLTAFPEERTNTVVVAAPASVMKVVEDIVKDLEVSPATDAAIQSFHLKYADATTAATTLATVFHEQPGERRRHPAGVPEPITVTADARTNTLIVNATAEAMKTAEKLIRELDASPADQGNVKFFHLKQADAITTAKLIEGLFEAPRNAQQQSAPAHFVGVNAQADWRSNTVIVSAPPDAMKIVEGLIEQVETDPLTQYEIKSYPLTTADADTTAKLITSVFPNDPSPTPGGGTGGQASPLRAKVIAASDERTNTVVVTAPPDSLKVIDAMVKLLDGNPGRGADMQVFQLQYADSGSAAKLIQSLFPAPPSAGGSRGAAAGAPPQDVGPRVNAVSDDRTNTLVVTAPGEVLQVIQLLVHHLDANPAAQETFFIYRLRNGQATDMALVLNQMFGNFVGGPTGATGGAASGASQASNQRFGQNGSGFGSGGASRSGLGLGSGGANGMANGASRRSGGTSGAYSGSGTSAAAFAAPMGPGAVANELTGHVSVVADPNTNALLVTTDSKYERQVRQVIAELDHPVPQVLIKVLVAEVTHDNSADFGTDFSILNTRPNGSGQSFGQTFGNPGSGLVVSFVEKNLNVALHALAQQNKLDVLSRPYILASDNQPAEILVGQEVPLVTSNYTTDLGQIISNYQYQKVGIIVDVTPHINPDGLVTLDVAPEISALSSQTVNVGPNVSAPVIDDRSASSRVAIRNGQTIVIGGLMQDQKTLTVNKVPILGDIPLIGLAFSRTQVSKTKTELLIFLTPHVAQQPDQLDSMSQDEMKGMRLTPNAIGPGTFQDHMRGLQRGGVPQTQPTTQPLPPVMKIIPASDEDNPLTTRPVRLPVR